MNANNEGQRQQLKLELLAKWRGGRARFWEYACTHSTVTIRIESSRMPGNLHIVCGACRHICGPLHWDDCALELRNVDGRFGDAPSVLRDAKAGFELWCGIVAMAENVEPVYCPTFTRQQ